MFRRVLSIDPAPSRLGPCPDRQVWTGSCSVRVEVRAMLRNFGGLLVISGIAAGVFTMPDPRSGMTGADPVRSAGIAAQVLLSTSPTPKLVEKNRRRRAQAQPLIDPQRAMPSQPPAGLAPAAALPVPVARKTAQASPPATFSNHPPLRIQPIALGRMQTLSGGTRPVDNAARWKLARDLQRELRRVGCYSGKIDGDWGPGSRRAMAGFVAKVNASLPVQEPDYILLSLLRGQRAQVCGLACNEGSYAVAGGRCRPFTQARHARIRTRRPQQRFAGLASQEKVQRPAIVQGIVTPMAGVPTRVFPTPKFSTVVRRPGRPHLRILPPLPAPAARPDRRHLEVIATRVPSRLGPRQAAPALRHQRWGASIAPPPPSLARTPQLLPGTQVATQPFPPKYYLGSAPKPRPRVYRSVRRNSFRSRRTRASFWRTLQRNGD